MVAVFTVVVVVVAIAAAVAVEMVGLAPVMATVGMAVRRTSCATI
jgi:hypothetical protein